MTRNLKQWEYIFDSDDDDVDNLNQMKKKKQKRSPSEWHHLTQQVKTRKSWRSGALHMVGCSVQLRCADGRSCRDSRLGCCCCCCCCCGCCCCRFLLTVPLGPLVDEKGRAQKAGTPPQPPPPTHPQPQPSLGPSDKSPTGPGMSIMPCGRVWPLLCASDFSLTAGYHHCLLSLHLGNNGGR